MRACPATEGRRLIGGGAGPASRRYAPNRKEAKEAEKERDRQRRKDKGGLLGNVGDTLSGR